MDEQYVDFNAEMTEQEMMSALLKELRSLAFVDIGDLYDDNNNLLNVKDMPAGIRRAIAAIEVDEIYEGKGEMRMLVGYTRKVKLWDKKGSIEAFMKHLGMFVERLEVKKEVTYKVEKVDLDERRLDIKNRVGVN